MLSSFNLFYVESLNVEGANSLAFMTGFEYVLSLSTGMETLKYLFINDKIKHKFSAILNSSN